MKLSKNSESLISFFIQHKLINISPSYLKETNKNILPIISYLYKEIDESVIYLKEQKKRALKETHNPLYNRSIRSIVSPENIIKPTSFGGKLFPDEVKTHIDKYSLTELTYTVRYIDRNCTFYFILEEPIDTVNTTYHLKTYDRYVDQILLWLYILNKNSTNATKRCAVIFKVYFYLTSLEKRKPDNKKPDNTNSSLKDGTDQVLSSNHVNTAFTTVCPTQSEIVIFRKEEWYKVFIHETFHNFALDFSGMNNKEIHKQILQLFPVVSEVNIYEAYTEFWAEIIHALFCSYFLTKEMNINTTKKNKTKKNTSLLREKKEEKDFINTSLLLIQLEKTYSFFQLVKTLDHMGITYKDLVNININRNINMNNTQLVRSRYKEDTSVLAYYIIKTILLDKHVDFILWCSRNNDTLFEFKKSTEKQYLFVDFIRRNYKNKGLLEHIERMEQVYPVLQDLNINKNKNINKNINIQQKQKNRSKSLDYLMENMRMSICEMG